ncbi:MAG: LLM class flavin-dependent oxidoreductase [Acidimicrobiales bacterium]
MRHAIDLTGFGTYAEAAVVAEIAVTAEASGWDGLFIWDHLGWVAGYPSGDPWISMTAAAAATDRICLGFDVTPLPRRRPQVVATAAAALDRFSEGRLVLGVGLGGVPREFEAFGEDSDPKVRADMLDEGLAMITELWSGRRVDHHGRYYVADGVSLAPLPTQQPRPPVWVGGGSAGALRRAARWDGYTAGNVADEHGQTIVEPLELRRRLDVVGRTDDAFDVAVVGVSDAGDATLRDQYAAAGATWWLECIHDLRGSLDSMIERVRQGP